MVGLQEKIFKTKTLRWLGNAILTLDFANTVNASYTSQALYTGVDPDIRNIRTGNVRS